MKGKILAFIFFGIFAAVGLGMLLLSVVPSIMEAREMKRWYDTPAMVVSAELHENSGDDSTTYKAVAQYSYRFNGRQYQGNRVSINKGSDNIGDYQQDTAHRLIQAYRNKKEITVWVNPDNPGESIVDKNIRWEMLAFSMLFVLIFGGVGFIGLFVVLFKQSKFKAPDNITDKPWLLEEKWASATIYSDGKTSMWFLWGFAVFWNLISFPMLFFIPKEVSGGNYLALIGALFPLIGTGLLIAAISKTLQWRRFGRTPFHMDPYPGAIGGHVGGYIDVPLEYAANTACKVTLNLVHSYMSGSGDDRSRKESIKWQDSGIAHTESQINSTRIWVRFDVPENMQESQPDSDSYYLWRLMVTADLPGVDFSRNYEIPVFATGEKSRQVKQNTTETAASIEHKYQAIEALIDPLQVNGGIEWKQPIGRNIGMATGLFIFGSIFAGAGWFLVIEKEMLMSVLFSGVGWLIVGCGLYTPLNSLWVRVDSTSLYRKRCILGIPVSTQEIERGQIKNLCVEQGVTSGKTVYYNVFLETTQGKKLRIAEGFKGKSEAQMAKESLDIFITH